jgi:hypothetical protein
MVSPAIEVTHLDVFVIYARQLRSDAELLVGLGDVHIRHKRSEATIKEAHPFRTWPIGHEIAEYAIDLAM